MKKPKRIELREPCAKCSHVHIALACPTPPPDPESDDICDNEKRAAWGLEAVETYAARTGLDISPSADGVETAISDLLADLHHVADREGLDFADMVERARNHYEAETAEESDQLAHRGREGFCAKCGGACEYDSDGALKQKGGLA